MREAIEYLRERIDRIVFLTVKHGLIDNQHADRELEMRIAITRYSGVARTRWQDLEDHDAAA